MEPTPDPAAAAPAAAPAAEVAAPLAPPQPPATAVLPEPPAASDIRPARPLRPGQLTPNWTTVFWLGWVLVAGGFAAVWYSSRVTGLATWWLGPETAPRSPLLNILPFVAPVVLAAMALTHRRWMPYWGILGAAVTALIAWGDVGGPARYFAVEFVLAAGGLMVSLASFAGVLRIGTPAADMPAAPAATSDGAEAAPAVP